MRRYKIRRGTRYGEVGEREVRGGGEREGEREGVTKGGRQRGSGKEKERREGDGDNEGVKKAEREGGSDKGRETEWEGKREGVRGGGRERQSRERKSKNEYFTFMTVSHGTLNILKEFLQCGFQNYVFYTNIPPCCSHFQNIE